MSKPQGYLHSANEALFCLLIFGLPYYQSIFYAGIGRVLLFCLFGFLLLFLVKHTEEISEAIRRCNLAFCAGVVPFPNSESRLCLVYPLPIIRFPFLTPVSKRPPPILLAS